MTEPVVKPVKIKATPKAKVVPKVVPGYNHDTGEFIA